MTDALGHKTRFSDSSLYDEVCVHCGATDARGDRRLEQPCPGPGSLRQRNDALVKKVAAKGRKQALDELADLGQEFDAA